jgi:AraC-like DNA-binding protein
MCFLSAFAGAGRAVWRALRFRLQARRHRRRNLEADRWLGRDLAFDATYSETGFVETAKTERQGGSWIVLGVGPGKTTRIFETDSPVDSILAKRGARDFFLTASQSPNEVHWKAIGPERNRRLIRLTRETEMSEFHFSRAFKRKTGLTPSQYFIHLRLEKARRLLRETNRSVIKIGLDVGYTSPTHFAQVFRRGVGISPSEYRQLT